MNSSGRALQLRAIAAAIAATTVALAAIEIWRLAHVRRAITEALAVCTCCEDRQ